METTLLALSALLLGIALGRRRPDATPAQPPAVPVTAPAAGSAAAAQAPADDAALYVDTLRAAVRDAGHGIVKELERGCIATVAQVPVAFTLSRERNVLMASARFAADGITTETLNRWNRANWLSRAWLGEDDSAAFELDTLCTPDAPAAQLAAFVAAVPAPLENFRHFLINCGALAALPPARAELVRRLAAALDEQRADRDMRHANRAHWGDTGHWVALALREAEPLLDDIPVTGDLQAWLHDRRAKLAAAHERYRREADDPDGFGSATFHELLRTLDSISAELQGPLH